MTRVAAFDLDGTITTRDCVVPFLRRVAGTPRVTLGILRHPIAASTALARRDRDELKLLASRAAFRGRDHAAVQREAVSFARTVHDEWLRSDTMATLRDHLARGDDVVIVSASYAVYVEPLAALLGVGHVLATRLQLDGSGRLTGQLDGPNCRGPEKVRRLHEWLHAAHGGRDQVEVVAYGDSPGDRELLADADEAHWVDHA